MIPSADALLAGLDEQQRVAAEALVGPVCMLAGAGTGKTRAITHRIAYGVATGAYTPSRVMALTFTSRAASELRGRLRDLGASGVAARTFHAAALSQLNFFWPQVVGGQSPSILDSKARLLGHVAERLKLRLDTATLRDVAGEIEWRKVSGLSFDAYGESLATRGLPGRLTAEQAVEIQRGYETLKDERHQLDFEDVLLTMAGMIEQEPSVAMQVREQYRFFVVDEYQDVSPLQDQLLSLWVGDRHELCVVGDASQTIYSFAGARAEYLLNFPMKYPDATVVRLEQNYRSTPAVIETANRLMRGRPGALMLHAAASGANSADGAASSRSASASSNAAANTAQGPAIAINAYPSDMAEARAIAQKVLELISAGVKAQDIAVLYRINVQAATLEAAFNDVGVSYQIRGSKRFFDLPEVKQAVMALRAASISIVGEPLFKSVSDVLRGVGWSQSAPDTRGAVRDRWESLNALMGLVDLAAPGTTFRAFTDELMERQVTQHEPTVAAVTFATLHSAKGLEWENVFVMGVSEGLIPISYAQTPDQIDEERRLLYVGITRAKRRLELSWAATGPQQRSPRERSRFLTEIERFNPTGSRTAGAGGARRG